VPLRVFFRDIRGRGVPEETLILGRKMRGRKPKPTVLKALAGNPGKRAINRSEPAIPNGIPDCPSFLDDEAKAEWFRVASILNQMGLLTRADRSALAAYCTCYSRWVSAEAEVRKPDPIEPQSHQSRR